MKSLQRLVMHCTGVLCLSICMLNVSTILAETPLERLVQQSGEADVTFNAEEARLASDEFSEYVSDYIKFSYDNDVSRRVMEERPSSIELNIPTTRGMYNLKLVEVSITSPDYRVETPSGEVVLDKPMGIHYRGIVDGAEGSLAAVSFFDGSFVVIASTHEHGNVSVSRVENTNEYVSFFDQDLLVSAGMECSTPEPTELPEFLQNPRLGEGIYLREGDDPCVRIHYEADFQLHNNKGSVSLTIAFIEAVHNQVAALYEAEAINMIISFIRVWDVPDPFDPEGSSGTALGKFSTYIAAGASMNGDLGHLVTLDNGGLGGIANGINVLCFDDANRICYSNINSGFSAFPFYSWTVNVVAHEMGHCLGSPHTHGCYWNGDNTQIDDCGNVAIPPGEGAPCFSIPSIIPPGGGTTMSYCHLVGVGINMSLGFGPQPGDLIRLFINGAPCLDPCPDEDGCNPPYQLLVENITETVAEVSWYHATETDFEVRYGTDGDFSTVQVIDDNTITLTGLESGTNYEVYVKTICTDLESEESGENFNTKCNTVYTLPFVELFEDEGWRLSSYELEPCWEYTISEDFYGWVVLENQTGSANTGPRGDHTTGFGKYVYAEASSPAAENDEADLISPEIDLGTAVSPFATFWYHMFGVDINQLTISVSNDDGDNWTDLSSIVGQQQTSLEADWAQGILSLSDYEGETVRLRFRAERGADFAGDIAIDDVIVTDSSLIDISINSISSPFNGCGLGATEQVSVTLKNTGYQTFAEGQLIDLELQVNGATVTNESVQLSDDLEPGSTLDYTFVQTLDLSVAGQYAVSVISDLTGDQIGGNNARGVNVVNKPIIDSYPYIQSFEDGSDWTSGGAENSWELGTPAKSIINGASDGVNAWVTGGVGIDQYNALEESFVEGPCFDFSNLEDIAIEMDVWWEIETIWEGATFQYSIDQGSTWIPLGFKGEGWFNSDTITTLPNIDGWTGTDDGDPSYSGSEGWVTVNQDMSLLDEEPTVFLRMFFLTDPFVQFDGIAFDNIRITGTPISVPCHEVNLNFTTCDPEAAGTVVEILQDGEGCDSVITTVTELLTSYDITLDEYTCDPDQVGSETTVFTASNTCDSSVTVVTNLAPSYDLTVDVLTCDPEDVGSETTIFESFYGCDSIVTAVTTLKDPYEVAIDQETCNSEEVSIVVDTLTASDGCDSIVTTTTTLQAPYEVTLEFSTCDPEEVSLVVDTLIASDDCDSIVTTNTSLIEVEAGFTYDAENGVVTFTNTSENATSYMWNFDDNNTSENENPTNTYTSEGDYDVVLIAIREGCDNDTFTVTITVVISGIDLISFIESVNVFPNPNDGNFAVEIKGESLYRDLTFNLYNVSGSNIDGRVVPFSSYVREIYNMNELPDGIYFLSIQSGEEQTTLKINILR